MCGQVSSACLLSSSSSSSFQEGTEGGPVFILCTETIDGSEERPSLRPYPLKGEPCHRHLGHLQKKQVRNLNFSWRAIHSRENRRRRKEEKKMHKKSTTAHQELCPKNRSETERLWGSYMTLRGKKNRSQSSCSKGPKVIIIINEQANQHVMCKDNFFNDDK